MSSFRPLTSRVTSHSSTTAVHISRAAPGAQEVLPLARAILSWNGRLGEHPGHIPVWGEVQQAQIQVAPRRLFKFHDLFDELKVKLPPQRGRSCRCR
jgi:hypothetical protein